MGDRCEHGVLGWVMSDAGWSPLFVSRLGRRCGCVCVYAAVGRWGGGSREKFNGRLPAEWKRAAPRLPSATGVGWNRVVYVRYTYTINYTSDRARSETIVFFNNISDRPSGAVHRRKYSYVHVHVDLAEEMLLLETGGRMPTSTHFTATWHRLKSIWLAIFSYNTTENGCFSSYHYVVSNWTAVRSLLEKVLENSCRWYSQCMKFLSELLINSPKYKYQGHRRIRFPTLSLGSEWNWWRHLLKICRCNSSDEMFNVLDQTVYKN